MSTKDIRPAHAYIPCDVCGRTLLRGERSEVFIAGGTRHEVCELCKPRALQEGWIREGAVPDYDPAAGAQERRRSVFGRRRRQREAPAGGPGPATSLDEALSGGAWPSEPPARGVPEPPRRRRDRGTGSGRERGTAAARERATRERPTPDVGRGEAPDPVREPRHVRAVPTGEDSRIAAAAEAFNASEHPRTVAGVSRSLGAPTVAVILDAEHPTLVRVVASWELCWYRYEVDLGSERTSVRLDGQGYELSELDARERQPAAGADETGRLHVGL